MIEIRFDLYKQSGKWAYGGVVKISVDVQPWDTEHLLAEIAKNQECVVPKALTERRYYCVLAETDAQMADVEYHRFYQQMILPVEKGGSRE